MGKARAGLEQARLRNPKDPRIWLASSRFERNRLGVVSKADGEGEGARVVSAAAQLGDRAKAADAVLAKALLELPDDGSIWAEAIVTAPRPTRKSKSVDALKRCDGDAQVNAAVARLFWLDRKVDKARAWFNRAATIDPDLQGDVWAAYYAFERKHGARGRRRGSWSGARRRTRGTGRCGARRGRRWRTGGTTPGRRSRKPRRKSTRRGEADDDESEFAVVNFVLVRRATATLDSARSSSKILVRSRSSAPLPPSRSGAIASRALEPRLAASAGVRSGSGPRARSGVAARVVARRSVRSRACAMGPPRVSSRRLRPAWLLACALWWCFFASAARAPELVLDASLPPDANAPALVYDEGRDAPLALTTGDLDVSGGVPLVRAVVRVTARSPTPARARGVSEASGVKRARRADAARRA